MCVELGEQLAIRARRNLAAFREVEVVNASYESWQPSEGGFDAVVAFTAFHWIDPEVRFARSADLLRPGGALAVAETQHVLPAGGDAFWVEVQEDYDAIVPSDENAPPPAPDDVSDLRGAFDDTGLFDVVAVRRHVWPVTYTADEYVAVLGTYSPNIALDPDRRRSLFDRIHRRVAEQEGGRVTKHYLATLTVGRRSR